MALQAWCVCPMGKADSGSQGLKLDARNSFDMAKHTVAQKFNAWRHWLASLGLQLALLTLHG